MRERNAIFGRLCLAVCAAVGLTGLTRAADNVWVGGGTREAPGNWNVATNWERDGVPSTTVPNISDGGKNWDPLVVEGTADAPVFVEMTGAIEGYMFRLRASYADITINTLTKFQTDTAITLRNNSTLRFNHNGGHFDFRNVDVGDGCTIALTTENLSRVGQEFNFSLQLNASGKMTMKTWSLSGKSGTVSFTLPLLAEAKAVRKRQLIAWPKGATNELALSAGTVVATAPWAATVSATETNLFAESPDLSALEVGAYQVSKRSDGFWVAWVEGPAPDGAALAPVVFDVPEGWTAKPVPTQAVQRSLTGNLALEQDTAFRQTLGGRGVNVAEITGGNGTSIFGVNDSGHGNKDTALERDVWLKVSGGTHDLVVGGSENHWQNNYATPLNGDIFVELGAQASAKNVVGAIHKSGNGVDNATTWPGAFTGNVAVTVKGTVKGAVVGGATSTHRCTPMLTGNTLVRVLAVQGTNEGAVSGVGNRFVGGSAYMGNSDSGALQTGNTSVEISLPENATGSFVKEIVGGSYAEKGSYAITGNTSVSISAPNAVDFTSFIYGASVSNTSTATVSGNSSVTLDGGTYSGYVFAGGHGANGGVAGKATLTLKGGVFTGTLGVSKEGAPVGSSKLIIDGGEAGIDLSAATVNGDFGALTLKSALNLGTNRLPNAALAVVGEQTLTIAVTAAEVANRRVVLGRATTVPEGLTVSATFPEGETAWADTVLSVVDGTLYCAPRATLHTWATPTEGSAWENGVPDFKAGDDVAFGTNAAQEPVTLGGDVRVGDLTVAGDYVFGGTGLLSADTATVSGTLTFADPMRVSCRYVRWVPTARATAGANNGGVALAELQLLLNGEPVAWDGATIEATQAAENGEHRDEYVLDGNLGTKWYWGDAPVAFDNCTLTIDAGEGKTFVFNGYRLAMADQTGRDPTAWRLEVSDDGEAWAAVDTRTYTTAETNAWPRNTWSPEAYGIQVRLSVADTLAVSGTLGGTGIVSAGTVSFAEGSALAVPAEGMLTLAGKVSGTAALDVSAWGALTDATVRAVLRAPKGFTLVPPEGYTVHYNEGCYWMARALTQPLTLALGADAAWLGAAWQDVSETPIAVAPKQWDAIPATDVRTEVTATADATLTLEAARTVGAFTVKPSEHTLTLGGAKLTASALTVDDGATLAATPATLALAGATINGTLTYDVASGSTALPALTGAGTLVKTGAGTLTLANTVAVAPLVRVAGGTLQLGSGAAYSNLNLEATGDGVIYLTQWNGKFASGKVKLYEGGTFRFWNGNSAGKQIAAAISISNDGTKEARLQGSRNNANSTLTGGISGHGRLAFVTSDDEKNGYTVSCALSDDADGKLSVRFASTKAVNFTKESKYSGGTRVETSSLTVSHAEALGKGDVTVESGATLTVASGKTLNLHAKVGGVGTVSGAVQLLSGASLDASAATAEACLTLNGTLSVAEGATIPVTLPEGVASGTKLVAWTTGPASATFVAAEETPLAPTARLVAKADGLYYEEMSLGTAGLDGVDVSTLSAGAQRQLAAAAFAAGAASVTEVTGTTAKRALTAEEIDAALTCFRLTPAVSVGEGGAATVTVAYDFGIAAMAYDPATGGLTVTARVQGAEGAAAAFAEGVRVELYAAGDPPIAVVSGVATAGAADIRLEVAPETARAKMARPLKVRAVAP